MNTKNLLVIIIVVLALVIMFQNTQITTVNLLLWEISMSTILLIVLMLAIGFALGYLISSISAGKDR